MTSKESRPSTIDEIAESFVARLRNGESPSISEYKHRFPLLAVEIDDLLPTLAMLEDCHDGVDSVESRDAPPPERIGDYIIAREIGRGGMGIVYEATHESMQRQVALKVMSKGKSTNQRSRFYREARAAGQLHHSNIVPVFEVGSVDGLDYYSMQFIRGQNLDLVIDDVRRLQGTEAIVGPKRARHGLSDSLGSTVAMRMVYGYDDSTETGSRDESRNGLREQPVGIASERKTRGAQANDVRKTESAFVSDSVFSWSELSKSGCAKQAYFRRIAAVGVQVADALAYAHHNGVLHRDIKPANLILDTGGTVWVLDFGLAKNEEENLTHTGDLVGTLRYMAPERFQGQTDERCDVYGLGLTLYELATLKHAFDESDHGLLVKQLASQEPPAPRNIEPRIPSDLETVILKAIDRDPNRRYRTATQLAEDLELFLLGHPIKARRISAAERFWRACRRNPAVTMMGVCIVSLLLTLTVGSFRFAYLSRQQMARSKVAEQLATMAFVEARLRNYELSFQRAQSVRSSRLPGQGIDSLAAVREATQLLPVLGFSTERIRSERTKLRNEAIAAMAVFDVQEERSWTTDGDWTRSVEFSRDFQWFAQSNERGDIRVCHIDGQIPSLQMASPGDRAWELQFGPDAEFLATRHHHGDRPTRPRICVWSLSDPNQPVISISNASTRGCGQFFAGRRLFAVQQHDRVDVYSLPSGKVVKSLPDCCNVDWLKAANDGRSVALSKANNTIVEIWNIEGSPTLKHQIELSDKLNSLAWDSERKILAAGMFDGSVLVWRQGYDQPPERHKLHQQVVIRVRIHPLEPRIVTEGLDATLRVLNFATGTQELRAEGFKLTDHGDFSADGTRLSFRDGNGRFGIWKVSNSPLRTLPQDTTDATPANYEVHLHPKHENIVVTSNSSRIEFWDSPSRRRLASIEGLQSTFVAFAPDGEWLYTSGDTGLRRIAIDVVESETGTDVRIGRREMILDESTMFIEVRGDGKFAVVSLRKTSNSALVNLSDDTVPVRFGRHPSISTVAISNDGKWVATGTWRGYGIRVWDTATGELVKKLLPQSPSTTVAFTPDSEMLLGIDSDAIHLWQCETWKPVAHKMSRNPHNRVGRVRLTNDGALLVANKTDYIPQLISLSNAETLAEFKTPHPQRPGAYSLSSDGSQLAVRGFLSSYVWDLAHVREKLRQMQLDWDE